MPEQSPAPLAARAELTWGWGKSPGQEDAAVGSERLQDLR